ncbi:hypothetical protein [Adonisia turfae]|uniref:Uncharacterized protein n=1 Tax=Adonisia turfae CCMR0081 TaxID=2292702 RepID=A0A6M0RFM6_9CYAN|nr:hypothetical protein [Adonisia turfae]NEZ54431.1 hypothetical protein [Adonisia turfae CCMR0081]
MAWNFDFYRENEADTLFRTLQNELTKLNRKEQLSAKVATADQKNQAALGGIIFNPDVEENDIPKLPNGNWKVHIINENPRNDFRRMFDRASDFLNNELNESQAFYAKLTFVNQKDKGALMAVLFIG